MTPKFNSPLRTSLLLCASFGLIAPAGAEPVPLLLPPSGVAANYDMFTHEFESLGADDGEIITEPDFPGNGCDGESCYEYEDRPDHDDDEPPTATTGQTDRIVTSLQGITEYCDGVWPPQEGLDWSKYRLDCLRWELHRIAQGIPSTGEYAEMREAISIASGELAAIVNENADATPPVAHVGRSTSGKARQSARRLKAIDPARQASANAQASAVLDRLSTRLLRSASNSATQRVHYERAAQAINSTKVLLRSA